MLNKVLQDTITRVHGARAVIFLDGEGEEIAKAGAVDVDMKFVGAWKEIHLDHIREIATRLNLGSIHAVLFSLDEGNELIVPVTEEYCLLVFLSSYAHVQDVLSGLRPAIELLKKEVE